MQGFPVGVKKIDALWSKKKNMESILCGTLMLYFASKVKAAIPHLKQLNGENINDMNNFM